MITFDKALFL